MRIGIDLGGTKTEILVLDDAGAERWRRRIATPGSYPELIAAVAGLVAEANSRAATHCSVGMAIPGSESFGSGLIKNANTVYLNGRPFRLDLEAALGRAVRLANDANCFLLSECADGAAANADVAFGVIAGTGLGGAVCVDGQVLAGAHGVAGEWGHIPLPAMTDEERNDGRLCYCGKSNCLETWCCGPALAKEFYRRTGRQRPIEEIAASDGAEERGLMTRFTDRLARGLATVVNILDPDVIVLGGGLSNIASLYGDLPPLVEGYAFTPGGASRIVKNRHGDSSGVRGAAWLWLAQPDV